MQRSRRFLTGALKLGVAVLLIGWMINSQRLRPSDLLAAMHRWPLLVAAAVLFLVQIGLATWRWNLLLAAQEIRFPYRTAFSLTMIGALFNVIIPGSVGGDVMKAYQVTRYTDGKRAAAVVTIGLDRVLGLLGLLLLAAVIGAFNIDLVGKVGLNPLWTMTAIASLGAVAAIAAVMTMRDWVDSVISRYRATWPLSRVVRKLHTILQAYQQRSSVFVIAIALSMVCHGLACISFYLCALTLGGLGMPLKLFFFLVPMGLVTTAIPISPAGVGVGQAAFFSLFRLAGHPDPAYAANACSLYQAVTFVVYLTGLYFYMTQRAEEVQAEAESLAA